jgi:hypothetical protein
VDGDIEAGLFIVSITLLCITRSYLSQSISDVILSTIFNNKNKRLQIIQKLMEVYILYCSIERTETLLIPLIDLCLFSYADS